MTKFINNYVVRFAALLSFIGLVSGYRQDDMLLKLAELIMLGVWLQMDFRIIKSLFKKQ